MTASRPELNPRQALFVQFYLAGNSPKHAAMKAGYNGKTPEGTAQSLLRIPKVRAAIAKHQEKVNKKMGFNLEKAMEEAQAALDFAREKNNPMAMVKATELRCKLSGLLIEKHDISVNLVSIDNALLNASNRVLPLLLEPKPQIIDVETRELEAIAVEIPGESEK